jgi:hypothetical protein
MYTFFAVARAFDHTNSVQLCCRLTSSIIHTNHYAGDYQRIISEGSMTLKVEYHPFIPSKVGSFSVMPADFALLCDFHAD